MSARHRWGEKVRFGNYKSEQQCVRCELVKVSRHENEGSRPLHWKEYWRDGDRMDVGDGVMPPCDARLESESSDNLEVHA